MDLLTYTEVQPDLGPENHGPFSLTKYRLGTANLERSETRKKRAGLLVNDWQSYICKFIK